MALPIFQNSDKDLQMLQTNWSSVLNPVIDLPINHGHIIKNVSLGVGITQVNHGLQRMLQGWLVIRLRAAAVIYDTQDSNPNPTLTLALNSNVSTVVDLFVF